MPILASKLWDILRRIFVPLCPVCACREASNPNCERCVDDWLANQW